MEGPATPAAPEAPEGCTAAGPKWLGPERLEAAEVALLDRRDRQQDHVQDTIC